MANKNPKVRKNNLFKRFLGNKNTVTFLGLLACVGVLVGGYYYRVKQAISPVKLAYAKVTIPSRTLITTEMVGMLKISSEYVSTATNLIKTSDEVVGKYVSYRTNIPKGSLFYKEVLKTSSEMPDAAFANILNGYTVYSLAVDKESTFANSIREGDYIDLYMTAQDPDNANKVLFARMIQSIRVLAVKDRKGNNIIGNSLSSGVPSELLFAVPEDMYRLLMASSYIKEKIKIIPVLRNSEYSSKGYETKITSEQLKKFIMDRVDETYFTEG